MQKLIVTSATYRQSSKVTPALIEKDPGNRLLARGPRLRLSAESIRDSALLSSGLLVEKLGGPSVKPYQPPRIWEELTSGAATGLTGQDYVQDHGEALYRRSMYLFWKRTVPLPTMTVFDAPSREVCIVRRSRTNTPLQALALLNDTIYVEAARKLAERAMSEGGSTPAQRIALAFRWAVARKPTDAELKTLVDGFNAHLATYFSDPEAANKLLTVGESPRNINFDARELAAYAATTSVILNMDQTITRE
jgi:alkylhydroperoxidase family enzyme